MTKEEIGDILRQLRLACNMTQKEVAEKLGRKQQIIGHWETGYSQPDANTLFTLCDIYNTTVDEAFGFSSKNEITRTELSIIEKYRDLDNHGKEMVDFTLTKEWERSTSSSQHNEEPAIFLQAAHNDYAYDDEELKKIEKDLAKLKRPSN